MRAFVLSEAMLFGRENLQADHHSHEAQTDHIGYDTGINQQKSADGADDSFVPAHMLQQIAFQSRRHTEHTHKRSDADQNDLACGGVDKEHGRVQSEYIGDDEGTNGQLGSGESGLHGVRTADGCTGISGQCYRRRQVGNDAEIEYEEVSGQRGDPHFDQDGCAGSGHNAVVGGGGNTHAQHDTAQHGKHQRDDHMITCQSHDAIDQHVGKTRHGDGAGDDAGDAAGGSHGDHALTAGGQRLPDHFAEICQFAQIFLAGLLKETGLQQAAEGADENGSNDGDGGGILNGFLIGGHQINQQHQRRQQVDLLQQGFQLGEFFFGQTPKIVLLGFQMDGDENAGEIEHSRQDGADGNIGIRNAHKVRHQESGRAQNGRHDLTAGGGGGFRCGGEFRLVAGFLHQRNGDRAGADGIGNRRTGNHALKSGGHHGNLGRAAGEAADHGITDIDEEFTDTGALQKRAEDDEHHDEFAADVYGSGEDTLLGEEQLTDGAGNPATKGGVIQTPDQRIDDKAAGNDQDGQTHAAAADLCQRQNADDADDDLVNLELGTLMNDGLSIESIVKEGSGAQNHSHKVVPRHVIDFLLSFLNGENQKAQHHDPRDESGQTQFLQPCGEEGDIQAEQRKGRQHAGDNNFGCAFPDADIGFSVIFFHDGL